MRLRRILTSCAVGAVLCTFGAAALWISPWGQEARRRTARGECPFPHGSGSSLAKLMDQGVPMTQGALEHLDGAASKTVWNLTLNASSTADVVGWAEARSLACHSTRKSAHTVECPDGDPQGLTPVWHSATSLTLVFHFDDRGILTGVRALGGFSDDTHAESTLRALATETQQMAGGAPSLPASPMLQLPADGMLSQRRAIWSRRDLVADLSATRLANQVSIQQHLRLP